MAHRFSYMVGGLLATVSPEEETVKLEQCAEAGWELLTVAMRKQDGHDYVIYYFRRENSGDEDENVSRFDRSLFKN